jgi:hypothetical protein
MESKNIPYPREDDKAPRMQITAKFCPDEHEEWKSCLTENKGKESMCNSLKETMAECGRTAIRKINTDPSFTY